jgi:hypothetical protein
MSAAELMADLDRLGIRLEAQGDRLRFHPRSAVTPDLADRLREHKGELLALLRSPPVTSIDLADCQHSDVEEISTFDGYLNRRCRRCGTWLRCRKAGALAENPGPGLSRPCGSCDPAAANDTSPEPQPGTVQGSLPGL